MLSLSWELLVFYVSLWAALIFWSNSYTIVTFLFPKIWKFFHFFRMVTDVITFNFHAFEKHFCLQMYSWKYYQIKSEAKILKNIIISVSRNPTVACKLCEHQAVEVC